VQETANVSLDDHDLRDSPLVTNYVCFTTPINDLLKFHTLLISLSHKVSSKVHHSSLFFATMYLFEFESFTFIVWLSPT
jgi:hypothetical protein